MALRYAEWVKLISCKPCVLRDVVGCAINDSLQIQKVANFISRIKWDADLNEEGGITWIELFIWYRMHSPAVHTNFIDATKPLQNEITKFKKQVRKINTHCIQEDREWLFQTCYARGNRLKAAAVSNKHAAVQVFRVYLTTKRRLS